ncbi:MAG: plasmid mobilization relaxosome protein MobC [Kiritimatiellae bacterium]|nr:plasmid mobilization relaxosome protein MobC [Kiritimatiellia bacterium]
MSGLCNNVNQIARAVNTMAREPTRAADDAVQLSRRAYQSVERIRELIAHGV